MGKVKGSWNNDPAMIGDYLDEYDYESDPDQELWMKAEAWRSRDLKLVVAIDFDDPHHEESICELDFGDLC